MNSVEITKLLTAGSLRDGNLETTLQLPEKSPAGKCGMFSTAREGALGKVWALHVQSHSMEKANSKHRLAEKATLGAWRPCGTCVHVDRIQAIQMLVPRRVASSPVLRIQDVCMLGRAGQTVWELS